MKTAMGMRNGNFWELWGRIVSPLPEPLWKSVEPPFAHRVTTTSLDTGRTPVTIAGMKRTRHVAVFDLTNPDNIADYEQLVNDPTTVVTDEQTFPTATGQVLRLVDYKEIPANERQPNMPVC